MHLRHQIRTREGPLDSAPRPNHTDVTPFRNRSSTLLHDTHAPEALNNLFLHSDLLQPTSATPTVGNGSIHPDLGRRIRHCRHLPMPAHQLLLE